MISQIAYIESHQHDPYANLGLEAHLFDVVKAGQCILYLWQNRRSVIIGRNQLAENECDIIALQKDGGSLVRRLSGGGAVYHDLGNLNFTFLMCSDDFDEHRQSDVILKAMAKLGFACEKTGRNDLTIGGRKFSGHAYYHHQGHSYHHGTIMLAVEREPLERYLHVSQLKLRDKHVKSVRARVVNLCELKPDLTVGQLKQAVLESFGEVYQLPVLPLDEKQLDQREIARYQAFFSSHEWIYGNMVEHQYCCQGRYKWGGVKICYDLEDGRISKADVYSDSLQADYLAGMAQQITGRAIEELNQVLTDPQYEMINQDILALLGGKE